MYNVLLHLFSHLILSIALMGILKWDYQLHLSTERKVLNVTAVSSVLFRLLLGTIAQETAPQRAEELVQ